MKPHCVKCYQKDMSGDLVEMLPMELKDAYECPKCQHEVTRVDMLSRQRGWMSR
jgi:uncharacterized paraquat-inducible protein A